MVLLPADILPILSGTAPAYAGGGTASTASTTWCAAAATTWHLF
ncbi:hypothetical protein AFE_1705 [Acidithiobacillus ferrooxidans ATCC 23270]|uniref:Uncharacterized protein n=1 Tax=Acidithiobacillus ferrooxidans (strain ATCC 23270 / DSM 14882 / CIP 104768 / NCIMB 8455) TaxID=243159 RepID=B7JB42_ACIF2|nr:hypothetical protein AFE_1705 [Acidithiobacillus ferrooxidans ATCC 23270]